MANFTSFKNRLLRCFSDNIQGLSFIAAPITAAVPHRKTVNAATSGEVPRNKDKETQCVRVQGGVEGDIILSGKHGLSLPAATPSRVCAVGQVGCVNTINGNGETDCRQIK